MYAPAFTGAVPELYVIAPVSTTLSKPMTLHVPPCGCPSNVNVPPPAAAVTGARMTSKGVDRSGSAPKADAETERR